MPENTPRGPKLFTVVEANAVIPLLEKALSELAAFRGELRSIRKDIEVLNLIAASAGGSSNPDSAELRSKRKRYRFIASEIEKLNAVLDDLGCVVKHPDEGLVDFFHIRQGRLVFLCWKVGETDVRYWHPLSGGFAGRQPVNPTGKS